MLTVVEEHYVACPSQSFDEFDTLRVVLSLDLLFVHEGSMIRRALEELESVGVERGRALLATEVLYLHIVMVWLPVPNPACGGVGVDQCVRRRAVLWRRIENEVG